jgi:signal transduction histidine kinase
MALALLPVLALVIAIGILAYREKQFDIEAELRRNVDTLANDVERQIEQEHGVLIALASLPWIRGRDFEPLRSWLSELKTQRRYWFNVTIDDRERQIFNLNRWPETDARAGHERIATTADGAMPDIGALSDGRFSLRVPVVRDGRVELTVVATIESAALTGVLRLHGLPPGWIAVVVDGQGRVIARNLQPELFVGRAATPVYLEAVRREGRRALPATTLDGKDALLLARTLAHGGWSVGIAAPRSDLAARWLHLDRLLLITMLVLTTIALAALAMAVVGLSRRRAAERAALRRVAASDARFRDGIEAMADGLQLWDAQGRLVTWNARYLELYPMARDILRPGMPQDELVSRLLPRLFPDATPSAMERLIAERKQEFRSPVGRWERRLPNGGIVEIKERETSDGGTVSLFRDITAEREAMVKLALSESRFQDFAASASDWFWETDAGNRFTYLSFASDVLAIESSQAIGRTRAEWAELHGVDLSEIHARLDAIMARREPFSAITYESRRFDTREPQVVELNGKPIFGADGTFIGYRGTGRDVTEAKRQEVELQRALLAEREMNAEQRRFIAIASHEFRTPLTMIDGAAQRIAAHLRDGRARVPDEVIKRLARIRSAVAQLTGIIDRTLSSASLEAGRIAMKPQRFDLRDLVREACARQRRESPEFEIVVEAPAEPLDVDGDRILLGQVLSNLLSNAVKYSGEARRIEVVAEREDGQVRVRVRDRGIGIPPDDMPKLFTRFFRARTAIGTSGIGIGLHIVREFVTLHGGTIDVTSEVGVGSTFSFVLPAAASAAPARVAAAD